MAPPRNTPIKFSVALLESLARDLKSGRTKLDRVVVSDDVQPNLRAIVRNTGGISYHVQYLVDGRRPYLKVGEHPGTTIAEARELTRTVLALAKKGIDPQAGLHERLIRELKVQGPRWRPFC